MLVVAAHHSMRQLQMLEPAEEQVAMEMLAERDQLTESIVTMALSQYVAEEAPEALVMELTAA
jgi:hypothetical protein